MKAELPTQEYWHHKVKYQHLSRSLQWPRTCFLIFPRLGCCCHVPHSRSKQTKNSAQRRVGTFLPSDRGHAQWLSSETGRAPPPQCVHSDPCFHPAAASSSSSSHRTGCTVSKVSKGLIWSKFLNHWGVTKLVSCCSLFPHRFIHKCLPHD